MRHDGHRLRESPTMPSHDAVVRPVPLSPVDNSRVVENLATRRWDSAAEPGNPAQARNAPPHDDAPTPRMASHLTDGALCSTAGARATAEHRLPRE
ncbi:hypothetical protein GCM10018793_34690 [Streptomyces sulfonofaciens]|uniref:Uncharacterized protein n=1 Tax=Streptomyces sulfonofaciens TaxID=68272 RepID=A0A919G8L9_9ACTN|nr:hypothetical protein GCM10018793_34690 [Streptomyces sulfonofaciens]